MALSNFSAIKSRPKQIFTVFMAGIILPAGFLSYLGFRSFQYETLMLHQQMELRYAAFADASQKRLESTLAQSLDALRLVANREPFLKQDPYGMTLEAMKPDALVDVPLSHFFVFDDDDRLLVPFLSAASPSPSRNDLRFDIDWGRYADEIKRLEHLEFVDKKYAEAIEGYEALQRHSLTDEQQAAVLKALGNAHRRLPDDRAAEANYDELVRRYETLPDPSGYPTGVAARELLAGLYESTGQAARALQTDADLFELLLMNHWAMTPVMREATLQECEITIKRLLGSVPSPEITGRALHLLDLRQRLTHFYEEGDHFSGTVWPLVLKERRDHRELMEGGLLRLKDQWMLLSPWLMPGKGRQGWFVAPLRGDPLKATLAELDHEAETAGVQLSLQKTATIPWHSILERRVQGVAPALTLYFYEPTATVENRLQHRRLWIFGGMIALSLLVMGIGLAVMAAAVRREMQIAALKADFVANVSHEIRTPLTAISYIGDRLHTGRYRSTEELQRLYELLQEETTRLRGLIEDILDFSKMLAGRKDYQRHRVDMRSLIDEALRRLHSKMESLGFTVHWDAPPGPILVSVETRTAVQAILNLLENALKYSGQAREIWITLQEARQEMGVSVKDSGIGIAPADREKIFEKFYRVERGLVRESSESGVGLGLAIVKHIMEGHGGRVTIESELGAGSVFTLWFPKK